MQLPDGRVRMVFCDVGQGDAALITLGYFQALIDTGNEEEKLLICLSEHVPFWDKKIDVVFISHGDSDHVGALGSLQSHYSIGRLIEKAGEKDIVRYRDLHFEILSGRENEGGDISGSVCDDNDCSMVLRMVYKKVSGLFVGDITIMEELALLGKGVIKRGDILKVAHHGSKFGSSLSFLEAMKPSLAVISVGAKNTYGHPSSDTLMRLDAVGAKTVRTDEVGSVVVVTDGEKMWMKK